MLIKVQKEREISSLEDLRYKRQQLEKKAEKKSKKIKKKVKKLSGKTTAPIVYDEILSQFDLQHGLMNMLPMLLKYREQLGSINLLKAIKKSPSKRSAIIILGAMSAGMLAYFSLSKKTEKKQEEKVKEKQTPTKRDELFV
ncbi:MAG: hypothetical protein DRJ10_11640 [Bacteroidetes bacterium]|nr:MAG: hypothetical protein DRJ10_11640 [Bacteroidota bacterium]